MDSIIELLPPAISAQLLDRTEKIEEIEEIRIRVGRPLEVMSGKEIFYGSTPVLKEDADLFLNKISQYSFYILEEELKRGYITVQGGHRVGLAGRVILENGRVKGLRDITFFNIRIARQKKGLVNKWVHYLYDRRWLSTLIIGAPQTGKTTFLRDLARYASIGESSRRIPAMKVGIVDERSEIAGCVKGVPQMDFGIRVDVLDGCPKAEGMMMLIRSMSPEIIVADEIGRVEDVEAMMEAVNAGITLFTTAHGHSLEDILVRPIMKNIILEANFERIVELKRTNHPGCISKIKDRTGRVLFDGERVSV